MCEIRSEYNDFSFCFPLIGCFRMWHSNAERPFFHFREWARCDLIELNNNSHRVPAVVIHSNEMREFVKFRSAATYSAAHGQCAKKQRERSMTLIQC